MIWLLSAHAALFEDLTASSIGATAEWSNKVVLDDVDGDGDLDIVFANGGDYSSPGTPEPNRIFLNEGAAFIEVALPGGPDLSRSIAVGDLNGTGTPQLVVSGAYDTPTRLFSWTNGAFVEQPGVLPDVGFSIGDLALGDVDGDGDLDVLAADWGDGDPLTNGGARTRLWRNDGATFLDVTNTQMPDVLVGMSWDCELVDVDNDFDLDALVSSKASSGSFLFLNDGNGTFTDASADLPQFTNNYEFAPMDVDADGDVDLVTINDGPNLQEHLFVNDGTGRFTDETAARWPAAANPGADDNVAEFVDLDDDGDPDFVIGSLSGADRALVNDGGSFTAFGGQVFGGPPTPGTLSIAFGDFSGDGKPDAVMAQGEIAAADRVYVGTDVAADTQPPVIFVPEFVGLPQVLLARIHDRSTPVRQADFTVELVTLLDGEPSFANPARWIGGQLWRVEPGIIPPEAGVELCAADRAGNRTCVTLIEEDTDPDTDTDTDPTTPPDTDDADGCGCDAASMDWTGVLRAFARR